MIGIRVDFDTQAGDAGVGVDQKVSERVDGPSHVIQGTGVQDGLALQLGGQVKVIHIDWDLIRVRPLK